MKSAHRDRQTHRHTDLYGSEGKMLQTDRETFSGSEDKMAMYEYSPYVLLLLLSLPTEYFKTRLSSLFDHHRASNSSKGTFAPSPV